MGFNLLLQYFHTIKSILNSLLIYFFKHFSMHFHTIKSILNPANTIAIN